MRCVMKIYAFEFSKTNPIPIKGIVSRDLGGLQMILLDRLEVFIISAMHFFYFVAVFVL